LIKKNVTAWDVDIVDAACLGGRDGDGACCGKEEETAANEDTELHFAVVVWFRFADES
jgi:hypothetical protein